MAILTCSQGALAIENGTPVNSGTPWIAYLTSQGVGPNCTGALVGPGWVLTAAHCLNPRGNDQLAVASAMRVSIGRYDYNKNSEGPSYGLQGAGVIYPGSTFDPLTHRWSVDVALIHLHTAFGGSAPLPLAPTGAVFGAANQSVAFGYGCTSEPVAGACLTPNSHLFSTTAGEFAAETTGCSATQLCFGQTGNQRLWTSDAGGPWAASIGGGLVGLAATSRFSTGRPQQVVTTPIVATVLSWIRSVTGLPTARPGEIWRDATNRQDWLIGQDGFRRLIPDGETYACLTSQDGAVNGYNPFTIQSAPAYAGQTPSCQGRGPASAVDAGSVGGCAVLQSGGADCWGDPPLGDGMNDSSTTIRAVAGLSDATAVSTSADAQFGFACALRASGGVDCWGSNEFGGLGNGTRTDALAPVPVSGLSGATQIAVGGQTACALLSDGTVKCWGDNSWGELGTGSDTGPQVCAGGSFSNYCSLTPVPVSGLSGVTQIAAGGDHMCALLSGGTVECWGMNSDGQLGDGTSTGPQACPDGEFCSPTPLPVSSLSGVLSIAAGPLDSCAVLSSGGADCWGENLEGELGDGNSTDSSVPVPVSGLSGVAAISQGEFHTCALLSAGGAECWGDNSDGELGDGTTTRQYTPVPVSGSADMTEISAGPENTCALLSSGRVDCWGRASLGEFPASAINLTPTLIDGIP